MAVFESKHGIVSKAPYELYMGFVDMRNFANFLPEDKKERTTALPSLLLPTSALTPPAETPTRQISTSR